ncbi:WXG100 family type VII secretion target [uncultured Thiodictyon sp.]|jgi:uncharacterized protein YukE|uniref:WXG100 family type VII secretion target n=1 Tax=uncultured Thiodictyon sp. TaxID=1846217 RepID=UPI0025FCC208|nr:WXG100 family type VII secretion target [uncultured Thiodictyon sp.]
MNDVYVDPEKLREFARVLKDFSQYAETSFANLNGQLGRLQDSWRDQEFEKFAAHVRKTQGRLKAFAKETAKTVPALERDAEIIEQYRKTQFPS